jgi:SAM-dependent methyltransferase
VSYETPLDALLDATDRAERDHFWFRGFRRFAGAFIARAANERRDLTILDCGCGTASNLPLLAPYGRVVGIDLSMRGLAYGRRRGQHALACATATRLPFADGTFDLVTSFDVIYSLTDEDEAEAFAEMTRVLRRGGALIVNAAAMPILRGNHSVLAREIRRYTPAMLNERFERAGLRTVRMTHTNATLFPLMLAVRLVQRGFGFAEREEDATAEMGLPPAPINAALGGLLALEARVIERVSMPFGSSVLALARKPEA